jgi:hypothetical protein
MPWTLGEATTEVRALLNEPSQLFWTDAQLQSWINQGCQDVARRAETLWQEVNINVVPYVQNYVFPQDFLNCHRAEYSIANSDQTFNLEYRGINQMDEIWGILHNLPASWPQYFTIRGNSALGFFLMLYPAPAAVGTMTVYYYRQAVTVTNVNAYIDVQDGWGDIVFDYAVYKAKRVNQDATWQDALQLYQGNLEQMINKTRNMTDQGEQVTTGIPNWPIYAYGGSDGVF